MSQIVIVGAGMSGIAAAVAASEAGADVLLLEPTSWLGGQLTAQMAPPDEHRRIERLGATDRYRRLRHLIRQHYRQDPRLMERARAVPALNPGGGWVSPLSHEPLVAVAAIETLLAPPVAAGRLTVWRDAAVEAVSVEGDRIRSLAVRRTDGELREIRPALVVDATETGELLRLAEVEHVTGAESRDEHGEPSAPAVADPDDVQSATWAVAISHHAGEDHRIDRPEDYDHWLALRPAAWGGRSVLDWRGPDDEAGRSTRYRIDPDSDGDPLEVDTDHRRIPPGPDLWSYRRVRARLNYVPGAVPSDVTVVNWPQNDYVGGRLDGPDAEHHRARAKAQSRALLYWLQHEAPRPDGGVGYPGLRPAPEVSGTHDGFAAEPYLRESRRIRARQTVREQDIALELRPGGEAERYRDSVGIGHYYWMDLHPSVTGRPGAGGRPLPFEIPLGALLPVRVVNLIAAGKNIGTTHLTNGCYRVHPVEWAIGEAAGEVAALAVRNRTTPPAVHESPSLLRELHAALERSGAPIHWPTGLGW